MGKTCDKILKPEDVTVGMVVGERLNCFKYSYIVIYSYIYGHVSMYACMYVRLVQFKE